MAELTYLQAISDGLRTEMRRDKRVFLIGEDVGVYGGAFKVSLGFQEEFGPWRVIDAPLSETAIVAGCTGAAMMGMRPVAEMQVADFRPEPQVHAFLGSHRRVHHVLFPDLQRLRLERPRFPSEPVTQRRLARDHV